MHTNILDLQLQRAYHLIRAGQKTEAFQCLVPLCHEYPYNPTVWWLMAHAVEDTDHIRYSLQQVLRIAPNYPRAAEKLAQLNAQALVPYQPQYVEPTTQHPAYRSGAQSYSAGWQDSSTSPLQRLMPASALTTATAPPAPPAQNNTVILFLSTIMFLLVGFSVLVGVLLYHVMKDKAPAISQALVSALATESASNQEIPEVEPSFPNTTSNIGAPAPPTPDPALFGDTYWLGAGDGITMDYLTMDGRYRRFYSFPVKLYVSGADTPEWSNAVSNAMQQIGQVVPITLTDRRSEADLTLEILQPGQVQRRCVGLSFTRVVGCASIDYLGGIVEPVIKGQALVATDTNNPSGTVLHELLHAVGVVVHSPDPHDVMYFEETNLLIIHLSQRDLNTLRRLYASPSYAD